MDDDDTLESGDNEELTKLLKQKEPETIQLTQKSNKS